MNLFRSSYRILKIYIFSYLILLFNFSCSSQNNLLRENAISVTPIMESQKLFPSGFSDYSLYVYVSPKVEILEFSKTYDNEFENNKTFSNYIRLEFERNFGIVFDTHHQTEIVDPLYYLDLTEDEDFYSELQSIVSYNEIYYLILIQQLKVNNDYIYGPSFIFDIPSGNLVGAGISSSERCVIEFEVQLIEVHSWQIVNNFYASGLKNVFLLDFESALYGAISNSVSNTITYLRTGYTDFAE